MKIVADVNVIVSATIAPLGASRAIIMAWREGRIELVTSDGIIAEVEEKLRFPRIGGKYHLADEDIRTALATLRTQAQVVAVPLQSIRSVTGDPEDDYVLGTATEGKVDYLVTGDKGLLELGQHRGVAILSPRQFVDRILASSTSPG